jgi:hypothetical protein
MTDPAIEKAVRRTVGIAVLQRMHRMIEAEAGSERQQARWAARLGWGFLTATLLALAWLAFR